MLLHAHLQNAVNRLAEAGIPTARLDVLVLLEDCLGKDRAWILAHPEIELSAEQISVLNEQISRRALHVPLAYIRGKTEFYGREFLVNDYVLEPRPESETMIVLLKTLMLEDGPLAEDGRVTIVDVGTGSGALAITAKLELPDARVLAVDIDPNCLAITCKNAKRLGADIEIVKSDLLKKLALKSRHSPASTITPVPCPLSSGSGPGDPVKNKLSLNCRAEPDNDVGETLQDGTPQALIILANLPYVPDSFHINQAATHEPRLAIFGGADGLDLYRELFEQMSMLNNKPAYVLTESMPPQHPELVEIAEKSRFSLLETEDFIQVFTPV